MRKFGLAAIGAALAVVVGLSSPAHAIVCTTTTIVTSGVSIPGSDLLTPGSCFEAGDKIFGDFAVNGDITGTGNATFNFDASLLGNVSINFVGTLGANQTGGLVYTVAVDPILGAGMAITSLQKDINVNSILSTATATATLQGTVNPGAIDFTCVRNVAIGGGNGAGTTCPVTHLLSPLTQMTVTENITTGSNTRVGALIDTISQTAIPEPASLALLGSALAGLGLFYRRRQRSA